MKMKVIAILMLISVVGAIPFGSIETEKDPEDELESFMEDETVIDDPFDATDDLAEFLDSNSHVYNNEMNDLDNDKYGEDVGEGSGVNPGPVIGGTEPIGTRKKRGMFRGQQSQYPFIEDESADLSYSPNK